MKSNIQTYCVFDLETTGASPILEIKELNEKLKSISDFEEKEKIKERLNFLYSIKDKSRTSPELYAIVEIAACAFDNQLNDIKEFESGVMRIYDNRTITDGALATNGITLEQIKNGVDPKIVANNFFDFLNSLKRGSSKTVLCGQNSDRFDIPNIVDFFGFFNKDLSLVANEDFTIDTMRWGYVKYPESTNYKLGTLCELSKVELINAHRAINDTRATKDLIKSYIRNLRSDSSGASQEKRFRTTFQF